MSDAWYVAGPMRGLPLYNFPAFDAAAELIESCGFRAINPAQMDREIGVTEHTDPLPDGFMHDAMRRDIAAIIDPSTRGIALLPGWEESEGVAVELQVCEAVGKQVWYVDPDRPHFGPEPPAPGLSPPNGCSAGSEGHLGASPGLLGEVRVTDPRTGGEKGTKTARFDLLPAGPLTALAEHYGRGAAKYEDRNWERGYAWSLSFAALQRHLWAFWGGEDTDPEIGSSHLDAAAFHVFALRFFAEHHPGLDDRSRAA